jgi:hypothetical protein
MSEQNEKRFISDTGYEVLRSQWVGGREFLLTENPNADLEVRYIVATYEQKFVVGQYVECWASNDFNKAVQEFKIRIHTAREEIKGELNKRGLPHELFTAEHCVPYDYAQDLNKKIVAIKAEYLAPEYRRGSEQLMYVTGDFGAFSNSHGSAVFCVRLSDGIRVRCERYQVLGIVKEPPDWAKRRLDVVKKENKRERSDAR